MTTLESIQKSISPELKMLNERIVGALSTSNKLMNEVVETYLKTKGKQIRPILVMLSAKMFGTIDENVISAAAAVEMLHNASLIHDDVIDETKERRNNPTINCIWDNHIAVLVGDYFVSAALQQAISTQDPRIITALSQLGAILSLGEIDQIYNAQSHVLSEEAYFNVIKAKTASLFVACVAMGGYAVKASDDEIEKLKQFTNLLGLCFQIRDDVFDYFEDKKVGKPTGNDLREGKITLPLLHVLLNESLPLHEEMLALSHKDNLTTEEIATLINYAKNNGGIEYAYEKMTELRNQAVEIIKQLPDNEAREAFIAILDYIIARDL
ncbi:MAG: polyprenyl synthetase family protein [Muribaculaceae bacterium]|nr:polyprenyl synthetase family protein [Muribaculaceae bacterium]